MISERPEFCAAGGRLPPGQREGPKRLVRRERSEHDVARRGKFRVNGDLRISVMPRSAATIWISVRSVVAWKTSLRTGSTIRHACRE
jgi:hypothetical protein